MVTCFGDQSSTNSDDVEIKMRGHYIDTSHSIFSFIILEDLWGRRGQSE